MVKKLGFIGAGKMGGAIIRGMLNEHYMDPAQVMICDSNSHKLDELAHDYPMLGLTQNVAELADFADMIVLAVKPNVLESVVLSAGNYLAGKAIISVAAGWNVAKLDQLLSPLGATYLRVMPNTPAMVCEGMTALCDESTFSKEDFAFAKGIFESVGRTVTLPERLFDGVIAISGSSPAYVFVMIEAMADAGVKEGLPRSYAYEMAAQAVLGAALMVLTSSTHPAALKDAVCSPGGTTIEAVEALEEYGFRNAIMKAMDICAEKSRKMQS